MCPNLAQTCWSPGLRRYWRGATTSPSSYTRGTSFPERSAAWRATAWKRVEAGRAYFRRSPTCVPSTSGRSVLICFSRQITETCSGFCVIDEICTPVSVPTVSAVPFRSQLKRQIKYGAVSRFCGEALRVCDRSTADTKHLVRGVAGCSPHVGRPGMRSNRLFSEPYIRMVGREHTAADVARGANSARGRYPSRRIQTNYHTRELTAPRDTSWFRTRRKISLLALRTGSRTIKSGACRRASWMPLKAGRASGTSRRTSMPSRRRWRDQTSTSWTF